MRRLRVYADTSVYGGCFDEEYADESNTFFQEVSAGRFMLVVAEVTIRELALAPEPVRRVLAELPANCVEFIPYSEEIGRLRDAYIAAGVLGGTSAGDAEHVASATFAEADLGVSWNFKHIVHFEKIAGFQAVNLLHGYKPIRVFSPREVVEV